MGAGQKEAIGKAGRFDRAGDSPYDERVGFEHSAFCLRLDQHGCKLAALLLAAPSFNGRTADSGSAYRGSNPWGAAKTELPRTALNRSELSEHFILCNLRDFYVRRGSVAFCGSRTFLRVRMRV